MSSGLRQPKVTTTLLLLPLPGTSLLRSDGSKVVRWGGWTA
jgi:hypothetical protein